MLIVNETKVFVTKNYIVNAYNQKCGDYFNETMKKGLLANIDLYQQETVMDKNDATFILDNDQVYFVSAVTTIYEAGNPGTNFRLMYTPFEIDLRQKHEEPWWQEEWFLAIVIIVLLTLFLAACYGVFQYQ